MYLQRLVAKVVHMAAAHGHLHVAKYLGVYLGPEGSVLQLREACHKVGTPKTNLITS